jgi:hypothetical protein
LFLEHLLELVHFLAQLCEGLLRGIGFLSAFLGGAEIGFFCSVFLKTTATASIVHHVRAPMLLAQVAMFLGTYLFWDSGTFSIRLLRTLLLAVQRFLVARRVGLLGSFPATYALDSLKRLMEQMHIHGSTTFLVKVVLVLPRVGTHSENVTRQISLGEGQVHRNRVGLHAWAIVPAEQLQDVGIELFHTLHKLMNADALGFLQHVRDVVPLLLCCVVGEHGEKVEHGTVFERLACHSPGPFSGQPLEVHVGVGFSLLMEDLVSCVPCIDRQKVRVELKHVRDRLITLCRGFRYGLQGLLKLSLGLGA